MYREKPIERITVNLFKKQSDKLLPLKKKKRKEKTSLGGGKYTAKRGNDKVLSA